MNGQKILKVYRPRILPALISRFFGFAIYIIILLAVYFFEGAGAEGLFSLSIWLIIIAVAGILVLAIIIGIVFYFC